MNRFDATIVHARHRTPAVALGLLAAITAIAADAAIARAAHAGVVVDSPDGFVVRSNGSVSVGGNALLTGSLGAGGGSSIGWGATVTGAIENGNPHGWYTPQIGALPSSGTQLINLGYQQTLSLGAGQYGAFTSGSETTLLLGAGDYTFSSFNLGYLGRVIADTSAGDVNIFVNGAINTGSQASFERSGPGNLTIVGSGSASFDYRTNLNGLLYTLGSQNFGSETRLNGLTFAGGGINVGYGSTFTFGAPVPGPAAVALLAAAAAVTRRRRR